MSSSSTVHATLEEFGETLMTATTMGEALGMSPCVALETFFPAIVGDDDIMQALASMLAPAIDEMAEHIAGEPFNADTGEHYLHNVFHLLQIAAALGHMLGVAEALAMAGDLPTSLDDIAWNNLPDVFGEGQENS